MLLFSTSEHFKDGTSLFTQSIPATPATVHGPLSGLTVWMKGATQSCKKAACVIDILYEESMTLKKPAAQNAGSEHIHGKLSGRKTTVTTATLGGF